MFIANSIHACSRVPLAFQFAQHLQASVQLSLPERFRQEHADPNAFALHIREVGRYSRGLRLAVGTPGGVVCPDCADEDTELMLRVARDDSIAFERLYTKHWPLVAAYVRTAHRQAGSPEDIVQEVFARLWIRRRLYRGQATFRTYLFAYVQKVCQEARRFHARERTLAARLVESRPHEGSGWGTPEFAICKAEVHELLRHALKRLTAEQRQGVELYYLEGMSLKRAADRAGCNADALESRLTRARRKMEHLLQTAPGSPEVLPV